MLGPIPHHLTSLLERRADMLGRAGSASTAAPTPAQAGYEIDFMQDSGETG